MALSSKADAHSRLVEGEANGKRFPFPLRDDPRFQDLLRRMNLEP